MHAQKLSECDTRTRPQAHSSSKVARLMCIEFEFSKTANKFTFKLPFSLFLFPFAVRQCGICHKPVYFVSVALGFVVWPRVMQRCRKSWHRNGKTNKKKLHKFSSIFRFIKYTRLGRSHISEPAVAIRGCFGRRKRLTLVKTSQWTYPRPSMRCVLTAESFLCLRQSGAAAFKIAISWGRKPLTIRQQPNDK